MRSKDEEYANLLENGLCERFLSMGAVGPGDPDAEAFFAEMTRRAEADGFPVRSYFSQTSPGSAFLEPGVMLLRPDGTEYPWRATAGGWINDDTWRTTLLPLLDADWGAQLSVARRPSPRPRRREPQLGRTDAQTGPCLRQSGPSPGEWLVVCARPERCGREDRH